jgi:hypothetical protein
MKTTTDGWRQEALADRKRREKDAAAMNAFVDLFEECEAGTGDRDLLCLALHHIAMSHGSHARKKTLKRGLRSGIEKLSEVAPAIFPPDRVPLRLTKLTAKERRKIAVT